MIRQATLALALVFAAPAFADGHWGGDTGSGTAAKKHGSGKVYTERRARNRARVLAYERRDKEEERGGACASKVRGLGTQWIGTEGAMDAAKKDWMERVRYDHGESFLDLTNAKEFESRCGRVSVGEVAGQVMYRCEIIARPCRPQMRETRATKKD